MYVFPLAGRPINTITVGELVMYDAHAMKQTKKKKHMIHFQPFSSQCSTNQYDDTRWTFCSGHHIYTHNTYIMMVLMRDVHEDFTALKALSFHAAEVIDIIALSIMH